MPTQMRFLQNYRLRRGVTFNANEILDIEPAGSVTQYIHNIDGTCRQGPKSFYKTDPSDPRGSVMLIPNDIELAYWQLIGEYMWHPTGTIFTFGGAAVIVQS